MFMNSLSSWFTKKIFFYASLLGCIIFLVSIFVDITVPVDVCYGGEFCGDVSELLTIYFLIFIPVLFFSLVTFKISNRFFSIWKNFSVFAVPITIIVISIFPTFTHGMDFFPIIKSTVALALAVLYSIISLILIIYKYFKKEPSI